jgi:hypothetical protein
MPAGVKLFNTHGPLPPGLAWDLTGSLRPSAPAAGPRAPRSNSKLKPDDELEGEGEEVTMQTWLSRSTPVLSPDRQVRIARGVANCAQIAVGRVRRPT